MFKNTGDILGNAGAGLTKSVTMPIAGVGTAVGKMALDFQSDFAKVSTLLDESSVDFGKYKNDILDASSQSGIAVGEFSEAVYSSMSAGVDQAKAIDFTTEAMKLAKGGFTDGASAVDVLTTAINGYGLQAEDATKLSDMLITTQNLGKTTADELSSSMGAVIPIASSVNFGMDELSASYAQLTKNGIDTAKSGTYMKSMLAELGKSGSLTDTTLREMTGKGFADLKKEGVATADILNMLDENAQNNGKSLKDMFGSTEAGSAALVLAKGAGDEYNSMLKAMGDSAGATQDAFDKVSNTPHEKMKKAMENLTNAGIKIGELLIPVFEKVVDKISAFADKLNGMSDEQRENVVKFAALAGAIGPVLLGVGKLAGGIGGAITSFGELGGAVKRAGGIFGKLGGAVKKAGGIMAVLTGPAGIVVAVLAGIAVAAVLVYKNFDKIKAFAQKMGDKMKSVAEASGNSFASIKEKFSGVVEKVGPLVERFGEMIGKIKEKLRPVIDFLKTVFEAGVTSTFEAIMNTISTVVDSIGTIFDGFMEVMDGVIMILDGDFKGGFSKIFGGISKIVDGAMSGLIGIVKTPLNAVINLVNKAIDGINSFKITFPDIVAKVVGVEGIKFNIPRIPNLYVGTDNWKGGPAAINEPQYGGEIVDLPSGSRVYPHDESVRMARADGQKTVINVPKLADTIIVREESDIDKIVDRIVEKLLKVAVDMP